MDGPGDPGDLDDLADSRWSQAFPALARTSRSHKLRALLERAEAAHRTSATLMRGLGQESGARKAEHFAAWIRLQLNEPELARLLYTVTKDLRAAADLGALLDGALDGAQSLLGADRGNVQIRDPVTGSLRIAAAHGFSSEFLDYFAVVKDDGSACGRAAARRAQTVITDVSTDPGFAPHREIAAAAGFRAVQSTPLVDHAGRVLGVISTHYRHPYRPPEPELQLMRRFGELVGEIMASRLSDPLDGLSDDRLGRAVASVLDCQPMLAGASSRRRAQTWKTGLEHHVKA
jgi:hypothetical protein